jgi:hypothetical protein
MLQGKGPDQRQDDEEDRNGERLDAIFHCPVVEAAQVECCHVGMLNGASVERRLPD